MKRRTSTSIARLRVGAASSAAALLALGVTTPAMAQLGNEWVTFHKDNSLLQSSSSVGVSDTQEKDYAWGDVNNDGWVDLVVARKQPFTSSGRRTNVLFMNDHGVLRDQTSTYAVASSISGDQGFLTPTNDRDIVLVDVDDDGWLDIVTATTISSGQPKHISHPRIYMNLGDGGGGAWLGFRYDDARIPLLLVGGVPSTPRFCSIGFGDLTGDGFPDLYFGDYDAGGSSSSDGLDYNDRLLINDGTGHFVDESTLRMTNQMLNSAFGMASHIADMNNDGVNDIIRDTALQTPQHVSISYNNPANEGYFNLYDDFHDFAPYHVNIGDLNQDGRLDVVITDDGADRYRYNLGNDSFGKVNWGSARVFNILHGSDNEFGGNNLIVDLDLDGWNDAIFASCDVDIPNCSSARTHIYHNPGGTAGAQITLKEEAQFSSGGGWIGVVGMYANDLDGSHDVAVFDIDNDGDVDMVFGMCSGTDVWINELDPTVGTPYCVTNANSTGSPASIWAMGSDRISEQNLTLISGDCPAGTPGIFFFGDVQVQIPFGDGNRCVGGTIVRVTPVVFTDGTGTATRDIDWSAGYAASFVVLGSQNFQYWFRDTAAGMSGFNLSNGVNIQFLP